MGRPWAPGVTGAISQEARGGRGEGWEGAGVLDAHLLIADRSRGGPKVTDWDQNAAPCRKLQIFRDSPSRLEIQALEA